MSEVRGRRGFKEKRFGEDRLEGGLRSGQERQRKRKIPRKEGGRGGGGSQAEDMTAKG